MNGKTIVRIIGLGSIAGMRTMSAPAFVSHALSRQDPQALRGSPLRWLAHPAVATVLRLMAAGELAGDKIPDIPARIEPGPLVARAASGALVGNIIARLYNHSAGTAALLGATSAIVGAFTTYYVRRALGEQTGLPDPLLALGEDALVLAAGSSLTADLQRLAEPEG